MKVGDYFKLSEDGCKYMITRIREPFISIVNPDSGTVGKINIEALIDSIIPLKK